MCLFSLYLIAFGSGCIRPCLSAFGGDQFDHEDAKERKQTPRYFNWLVFAISIGGILATTIVVHVGENVSWTLSFITIGIAAMCASLIFVAGTLVYRHHKPQGSPFTTISQVFVAAFRNRKLNVPADPDEFQKIARDCEVPILAPGDQPRYLLRHTKGMRYAIHLSLKIQDVRRESSSFLEYVLLFE